MTHRHPPAAPTPTEGGRTSPSPARAPSWRNDPDGVAPTVLVLGGFLTSPPIYRPFAARLRARGAADVLVARIWTPDWLLVTVRGMGPVVTRAGRGLLLAGERSAASSLSRGAPVLIVGHSAGGIVGRLLTSPEPFAGRRLGASERIGAIATLGTPHHVAPGADIGGRVSGMVSAFVERVVPGAAFAPRVGYVTVASRAVEGRADGDGGARTALRFYRGLLDVAGDRIEGDSVVPVASALLEGTVRILLDDAIHGQYGGGPWYGSEEVLDRWWPAALDAWHAALRARVEADPWRRRGRAPIDPDGRGTLGGPRERPSAPFARSVAFDGRAAGRIEYDVSAGWSSGSSSGS